MQVSRTVSLIGLPSIQWLIHGLNYRSRRVKCDERRPSCQRCEKAGRECRGYETAPVGSYTWLQLLTGHQPCLAVDTVEARSLSYYHSAIVPSLAKSLDSAFWCIRVPQLLDQEPVIRHAVLAISALHEDFEATLYRRAVGHLDNQTTLTTRLEPTSMMSTRCEFALGHYNKAIRMVLEDRISDVEALLTVSLLFTCIELLQGGTKAAAQHSQHGVQLYQDHRLPPELATAFYHLSIFPQFFDGAILEKVAYPQQGTCPASTGDMDSLMQARQRLDIYMGRGARLLQVGAQMQWKGDNSYSRQELLAEQFEIRRCLDIWSQNFTTLRSDLSSASLNESDAAALRLLEARWLVSSILLDTCLKDREKECDKYLEEYRRIVQLAEKENTVRNASRSHLPSFSLDMGYLPLLYITCNKCRHLRLRVRALVLMKDLSCSRETVWDSCIMYATSKWAIEVEHGLVLDEVRMRDTHDPYPDEMLAADAKRIVAFNNTNAASLEVDADGNKIVRRRIRYFLADSNGVVGDAEWGYTAMRI